MVRYLTGLIILLFITHFTVFGQSIQFGIKGGIQQNLFTLNDNGNGDTRVRMIELGQHAGVFVRKQLNPSFVLQPELLFCTKGGTVGSSAGFSFNTLDLSLNVQWEHEHFFIGLGPNISYLLTAYATQQGSGQTRFKLFKDDNNVTDQIKTSRIEMGANLQLGYNFPGGFLVAAKYTPGLSRLIKNIMNQDVQHLTAHNTIFGLSIGYIIPGKTSK